MSTVKILGSATGTANFTITVPAGTSTDRTLTLPNVTGTFNTSGAVNEVPAGSASAPSIYPTGDTNTGIFFPAADTVAISTGGTEAVRLNSSQNLLLGTATSTNNLRLNEKFAIVHAGSATYTGMAITGYSGSTAGYRPLFEMQRSRGTTDGSMTKVESGDLIGSLIFRGSDGSAFQDVAEISVSVDGATGAGDTPGRIVFATSADGSSSPTERARIDSSGNLLVGQTGSTLGGDGGKVISNGGSSIPLLLGRDGDGNAVRFYRTATQVGSINLTSGATAYNTSSDYRLKENIQPMSGALAKVQALNPVTYKWKSDGSDGEGFIAHELAEVCPNAVTGEKDAVKENGDPDYQGIDTSFLVATLTAAIQELKAELDAVKVELATLKGAAS